MSGFDANINEEFGDSSVKPTLTVPVTIGPDGKPTVDDKFFKNNEEIKNFAKNVKEKNTFENFPNNTQKYDTATVLNYAFAEKNNAQSMGISEADINLIDPKKRNGGKSKKARKAKKSKGGKSKKARKSLRRK